MRLLVLITVCGSAARRRPTSGETILSLFNFLAALTAVVVPVFRIGTNKSTEMNLEDCSGCGIQGWGWQDNGWGIGVLGPLIRFQNSGTQTLRIQVREDGLSIDQIVLSSQTYLNSAPGSLKNDSTILPKNSGGGGSQPPAPTVSTVTPNSGSTVGGTSITISGTGFHGERDCFDRWQSGVERSGRKQHHHHCIDSRSHGRNS